ncbi:MAG: sugar transferase [Balneolales bacterium]|nr:sugar transferase [Balneolales bacterium]
MAETHLTISDTIMRESQRDEMSQIENDPGGKLWFHEIARMYSGGYRIVDLVFATVLLVLSIPLFPFLWMGVKLTSKGPALIRVRYIGFRGKAFYGYVLRSFEHFERGSVRSLGDTTEDFPPLTSFGKFLQFTNLHRMPLLLKVFTGEMSLVGCTLYNEHTANRLNTEIRWFYKIYTMKPGIFSAAEVNGAKSTHEPHLRLGEIQSAYDIRYALNSSIFYYFKVMLAGLIGYQLGETINLPDTGSNSVKKTSQKEHILMNKVSYS